MQFHPLAYIVKLNIEMSMAELIAKISRSSNNPAALLRLSGETSAWPNDLKRTHSLTKNNTFDNKANMAMKPSDSGGWSGSVSSFNIDRSLSRSTSNGSEMLVNMKREVQIQIERRRSIASGLSLKEQRSIAESARSGNVDADADEEGVAVMTGVERGMGVHTKVWGP